jgi:serine/threonine protein kinase
MPPETNDQVNRPRRSSLEPAPDPGLLSQVDTNILGQGPKTAAGRGADSVNTKPLPKVHPGVVLNERYLIEKELGRGGMGVVYLARDQQLYSKPVVIKILSEKLEQDEWFKSRFFREAEALARIDHPGVVGVLDAGEMPDGEPYLVMQFIDGVNLRSLLHGRRADTHQVADLVRQTAQALAAAHEKGIFHRDLKPENIMLQTVEKGEVRVKIIDFGLATVTDSQVMRNSSVTKVSGTYPYMAPEQLIGRPMAASDIFALGVIAYEMLTGRCPFNPDSPFQLLEMQRQGVEVKPRDLRPDLSEAAERAILKALAFEPGDRHSHATDFSDELAAALLHERSSPEPPAQTVLGATPKVLPAKDDSPSAEKRAGAMAFVVGVILAAGVLGAVVWWRADPVSPATTPAALSPAIPERALSYSITVQRYRDGAPYREPFRLAREMIFEKDFRVRLTVDSPEAGYLYILNEGPAPEGGTPAYNVLFPSPTTNGGLAQLTANQPIQIPERSWFQLDDEEGTEKIWLVWSAGPVEDLEATKQFVNSRDKGTITDVGRAAAVRDFLAKQPIAGPDVERDEERKQTNVRGRGDVLTYLLRLEHH